MKKENIINKEIRLRDSKILLDVQLCNFYEVDINDLRKLFEVNKDKFDFDSYFYLKKEDINDLRKNLIINDIIDLDENNIAFKPTSAIQLSFYLDTQNAKFMHQEVLYSFKNNIIDNINYSIFRNFDGCDELIKMLSLISDRKENSNIGFKIKNLNS